MRRSMDQALLALRDQVKAWAGGARPDVRVFVYPPEHEAAMLARLPSWAQERHAEGIRVELVDVGAEWLEVIKRRGAEQDLAELEAVSEDQLLMSLRTLTKEALDGAIRRPLPEGAVARILTNTGALATIASYSAITNEFYGSASAPSIPVAICFPGEADDKSLNLLGLRADTNYRVPRI